MEALNNVVFFTVVAFVLIHEMDAIQQREWKFFFSLTPVDEKSAYQLFTVLHLPLYVLIFWNLSSPPFQIWLDVFMIIHAGLHWLLRNHPNVHFNHGFSRVWIFGGAVLAIVHLGLLSRAMG